MGRELLLSDREVDNLERAALLHDVGQVALTVPLPGGASILDDSNFFRIGQKNIMAMRKLFWSNNVLIDAEDTGKNFNRTVKLDLATGKVFVKRSGGPPEEL